MKTDKNTVIGFVLLGILFFGYFYFTNQSQQAYLKEEQRKKDSIARVQAANAPKIDPVAAQRDSLLRDSLSHIAAAGNFQNAGVGNEQTVSVENELIKVVFTNKGGQPKSIELKRYKSFDSTNVIMAGTSFDNLSYTINTAPNQSASTGTLFFAPGVVTKNPDGSSVINFSLSATNGQSITHQYIVRPNNYMIDWNVQMNGSNQLLTNNALNVNWQVHAGQHQSDVSYERQQARLCYLENNDYDFETPGSGGMTKKFEEPAQWFTVKQQFFNATLIAKNNFTSGEVNMTIPQDSSKVVATSIANMKLQLPAASSVSVPFQLYYGPNEFNILKKYNMQMENIIDLGSGIFSFVKYINRYVIMPVFDFFAKFIGNYGWVIAFLTIFIRLVTSPLTYTSYLSGAKMKVLRPELDVLKKKHGEDKQAFAMDQMKLFREAGVNPLGGCIPALLQIPIFFALYSFFNSEISLRGQSFLWADDLSSYDVIVSLPFHLWQLGDHISLFTITAVITSFLISIYNMSMTPDQDNPVLKYMPYFFPFILLFIFNRLPAALTWYYTVSNIITLLLQFVIQNYIINHDKILAKMAEIRKKPKTKSKWQERYDQMMESQKKLQDTKQKNVGKK